MRCLAYLPDSSSNYPIANSHPGGYIRAIENDMDTLHRPTRFTAISKPGKLRAGKKVKETF